MFEKIIFCCLESGTLNNNHYETSQSYHKIIDKCDEKAKYLTIKRCPNKEVKNIDCFLWF